MCAFALLAKVTGNRSRDHGVKGGVYRQPDNSSSISCGPLLSQSRSILCDQAKDPSGRCSMLLSRFEKCLGPSLQMRRGTPTPDRSLCLNYIGTHGAFRACCMLDEAMKRVCLSQNVMYRTIIACLSGNSLAFSR